MSALRAALRRLPDAIVADLLESDDEYLLVLDLPGATDGTVDVRLDDGRLHVEARREKDVPPSFRYLVEERPVFLDVDVPLPPDVTDETASASMARGVLEVRLPKRDGRGRSIPIEG